MNISSNQSVLWDSVPGAIGYTLQLLNASLGLIAEYTLDANETSIPASELFDNDPPGSTPFGNYYVVVRANEVAGPGNFSSPFPLTFVNLPAPQNLRVE